MTRFRSQILGLAIILSLALPAGAADDVYWTYEGEHGPEHWADLSPDFAMCGRGANQSPINIVDALKAELPAIQLDYHGSTTQVVNDGHTLKLKVEKGSFLQVDGHKFELVEFHLHSPSEHKIAGEKFPLEVHSVHSNQDDELAVVGVLFRLGEQNASIEKIQTTKAKDANTRASLSLAVADLGIVPTQRSYYRYSGSLTTPPCSEGVRWFVLDQPASVSQAQVDGYLGLNGANARDTQPLNARHVLH